ncbi:ROK family protein [Carboxydothermus ferrireducens]|uniref:Glucokinase n=1 Tax=Carboxydothermus ferrireducens DSM 11255 TaxID=1119529 RepID=A0ABX2RB15_9THEO|nr:ROK family protein [Carboxydothermus ferrireducens]NYE57326.1 glucokinase [Carboxydothermus ferrireducens DSM 11255]
MGNYVVGIDLGGTKIYTALANLNGEIVAEEIEPTTKDETKLLHQLGNMVKGVIAKSAVPKEKVLGIGIGAPGTVDHRTGTLITAPNLPWQNYPLKINLQALLRLPVEVDNDANLAALGEYRYGAGRGHKDLVYVTVSTGIGAGIIIDGQLYRGSSGSAGELGHTIVEPAGPRCNCGRRGCLEVMASGTAIGERARQLVAEGFGQEILKLAQGNIEAINAKTVGEAFLAGDPEAKGILNEAAFYLGIGLANVVNLLNPSLIVLGGGVINIGEPFLELIREELAEKALPQPYKDLTVKKAVLGSKTGVMGAIALALERFS